MYIGVMLSIVSIFTCFSVWAQPYGLYVKQSPTKNLLTENAYEGFKKTFHVKREDEIRTGNSATDGLHINLVRFPSLIMNSAQYGFLKDTSAHKITGRILERVYEQKLRSKLKSMNHKKPIYILAHEAFENNYLKVSSYMGQAEVYNLNEHFILFLSEKPISNSPQVVSLPVKNISMSLLNSESLEGLSTETIDRPLTNISKLPLKNIDRILTQDLALEFTGKLPSSVDMDVEFSTMKDSDGFSEYFTIEKKIKFSKICRFIF